MRFIISHLWEKAPQTEKNSKTRTLLVFVSETASLIGPGGPWGAMDFGELAILPAPDPEQVAHNIALLLSVKFGHIFISPHDESCRARRRNDRRPPRVTTECTLPCNKLQMIAEVPEGHYAVQLTFFLF